METIHGFKRTSYCGEVTAAQIGQQAKVCGWVQKQRDLGNLIFIDLRDRTGIVQLAFDDGTDRDIFEKAFSARAEFVLAVTCLLYTSSPAATPWRSKPRLPAGRAKRRDLPCETC